MKKEFPFLCEPNEINGESIWSKQIYKYFTIYKNKAIVGLLLRKKENENSKKTERLIKFNTNFGKNPKKINIASKSNNCRTKLSTI